jgi:hypothetical protein
VYHHKHLGLAAETVTLGCVCVCAGKAKTDKYERDERLLRRDMEENPTNPRTVRTHAR